MESELIRYVARGLPTVNLLRVDNVAATRGRATGTVSESPHSHLPRHGFSWKIPRACDGDQQTPRSYSVIPGASATGGQFASPCMLAFFFLTRPFEDAQLPHQLTWGPLCESFLHDFRQNHYNLQVYSQRPLPAAFWQLSHCDNYAWSMPNLLHWVKSCPFQGVPPRIPRGGRFGIILGAAVACRIFADCRSHGSRSHVGAVEDAVELTAVISYLRLYVAHLMLYVEDGIAALEEQYTARVELAASPLIFDALTHDGPFQAFTPYSTALETSIQDLHMLYCELFSACLIRSLCSYFLQRASPYGTDHVTREDDWVIKRL